MFSGWFGSSAATTETPASPTTPAVSLDPAPQTEKDYADLYESSLKTFLACCDPNDDSWTMLDERDGLWFSEKVDPSNPANLIRVMGEIEADWETLFTIVQETRLEKRNEWDPEIIMYEVLAKITENIEVIHQGFRAPFPVTCRDFVAIRCRKLETDRKLIFGTSIRHDSGPERTDFVRGAAPISGFLFERLPDKPKFTRVIHIVQIDPRGWIPASVVNFSKAKTLERIVSLRNVAVAIAQAPAQQ